MYDRLPVLVVSKRLSPLEVVELTTIYQVGAGPVGLACALCLLKNGIPVRIIEKANDYHNGARGTAIQVCRYLRVQRQCYRVIAMKPRTQEALSFLRVLEDVLETSTPPLLLKSHGPDGQEYKAVVWSQGADDSPGIPYVRKDLCYISPLADLRTFALAFYCKYKSSLSGARSTRAYPKARQQGGNWSRTYWP